MRFQCVFKINLDKKGGNPMMEKRYFEQSQNGTSRLGRTEEVLTGKNRWDEK